MTTLLRRAWKFFSRYPMMAFSLSTISSLIVIAALTTLLSHYGIDWPRNPNETHLNERLLSPNWNHWLGTDHLGRDVFSRMLHGTTISITVGLTAMAVSLVIGVTVGTIAGYYGGKIDQLLMRSVDALLCFPTFFLMLTTVALLGPSLRNIIVVLGFLGWTATSRLLRAEILTLREKPYFHAARVLGERRWKLIFLHLLPNTAGLILVTAILGVPEAILAEAGLSFLGFGVQPPQATWGNIIADGKTYFLDAWWLIFFPGLAILITSLSFYLLGNSFLVILEKNLAANNYRR